MTYFIVMCDYPAQRARQALVDPELTRRNIIDRIASADFGFENVLWVHEIKPDGSWEDVTSEIVAEAFGEHDDSDAVDHQANRFDFKRDELKHMERV